MTVCSCDSSETALVLFSSDQKEKIIYCCHIVLMNADWQIAQSLGSFSDPSVILHHQILTPLQGKIKRKCVLLTDSQVTLHLKVLYLFSLVVTRSSQRNIRMWLGILVEIANGLLRKWCNTTFQRWKSGSHCQQMGQVCLKEDKPQHFRQSQWCCLIHTLVQITVLSRALMRQNKWVNAPEFE